jgi:ubiquinone/menaquinone biosynthesis C-methylase UbiE
MSLLRMEKLDQLQKQDRYYILDLWCGSGVTAHEPQVLFREQGIENKVGLTCGDFSDGQLEYLDKRIKRVEWKNTVTRQMDA